MTTTLTDTTTAREFLIYCRLPGARKSLPYSGGDVAHNLIHADHFPARNPDERMKLAAFVEELRTLNPDIRFELRAARKGQRIF